MNRKLVWLMLILACATLATACDPCPTCVHEVVTPTPTATPTLTPTPTPTATGTATPTATPTGFGPGSFKGSYSLRFSGKTGGGHPDAGVGLLSSDGVSKVTGTLTENKNGGVCSFTLSGSYTVNPDGTGTISVTEKPISGGCTSAAASVASVLFNMGKGAIAVSTTSGTTLGSFVKQ